MIKEVTPMVHRIGKTVSNDRAIGLFCQEEYPNSNGLAWLADTEQAASSAEVVSEFAGRLCYMSFDKPRPGGNAAYLQHIKEVGHGSVLEHVSWNFLITGVSRSCTHELVRHRAGWAYSQLSQRYVDESVAEYVCPDIIKNDPEAYDLWCMAVVPTHNIYMDLVKRLMDLIESNPLMLPADATSTDKRKAARQAARSVLPNATETKIVGSCNARAARHFLEMRASEAAEPEIRKVANLMYEILVSDSPSLFGDYQKVPLPDGTYALTTEFEKI